MKYDIYRKIAFKKVLFSLSVAAIYTLGCHIILPGGGKGLSSLMSQSPNLSLAFSMTGMSLNHLSLFSLGLGPWMSSLIFWRVLYVTKVLNIHNLTYKKSYHIKFILSLVLGGAQSFMIITQVRSLNNGNLEIPYLGMLLILLSGLSVLIWLGSLNSDYGIGGPTIIILLSMIYGWPSHIMALISQQTWRATMVRWILPALLLLLLSFYIFRFYQGERRLRLNHVMLDEKFSQIAYLPISTNPSGGMPFMLAFSVALFPQYMFFILKTFYRNDSLVLWIYQEVQMDHLLGVIMLTSFVVLLTFGYSYVNIDYLEIAEQLQKSGDYFYGVYPGKNTERFLFHNISKMAMVSAFLNALIVGLPAFASLYYPSMRIWATVLPTWFILIMLMQECALQFTTLYHRNDYQAIISEESK